MMQVSKKIPLEDPQVLLAVRIAYVVSNLVILGIYLFTQKKINDKKGKTSSTSLIKMRCDAKLTL